MAVNTDAKFEVKMTCVFKNDMRNLANFHQSTFESLKIGALMGSSYPKQKMYELQTDRGLLRQENEKFYKMRREIDLSVQN